MNAPAPKLIAIAVVEEADRFLVGQRPPDVPLAGLWEFPGGKVEPGEPAEAAAVRECAEETGLTVEVLAAYPEHVHTYAHGPVRLCFFACRPLSTDPPRAPFRWVPREELASLEFPAGNAELLRRLVVT